MPHNALGEDMRTLITGGAGFVGSNLAMRLKQDDPGDDILVLDNLKRRGSELNLQRLRNAGIKFFHGDIRMPEDLDQAGQFDLLIECSAEPSVLAGYGGSPDYLVQTNLAGTLRCLELVRRYGASILFLSTSRVYPVGPLRNLPLAEDPSRFSLTSAVTGAGPEGINEEFPLAGARSLYGATKLASEIMVQEYADAFDIPALINRCGVLAGPWQMGKVDQGVVMLWLARHFFGGSLQYIGFGGSGRQVRDLLHIDDLYGLLKSQISALAGFRGEVFNVGGGLDRSVSLLELTGLVQELTGNAISLEPVCQTRSADIPWYVTDAAKARAAFGWRPARTVRDILADAYAWLREDAGRLRDILSS